MDIDELKSPALYFGTTTGQLWIGRDGGEEWDCLFDSLPPIQLREGRRRLSCREMTAKSSRRDVRLPVSA